MSRTVSLRVIGLLVAATLVVFVQGVRILVEHSRYWPGSTGPLSAGRVLVHLGTVVVLAIPLWGVLWLIARATCRLVHVTYDRAYTAALFLVALDVTGLFLLWVAPRFA